MILKKRVGEEGQGWRRILQKQISHRREKEEGKGKERIRKKTDEDMKEDEGDYIMGDRSEEEKGWR